MRQRQHLRQTRPQPLGQGPKTCQLNQERLQPDFRPHAFPRAQLFSLIQLPTLVKSSFLEDDQDVDRKCLVVPEHQLFELFEPAHRVIRLVA